MESKIVRLTQEEFDNLLDYSCSYPTGTTIGKKWKRRVNYYNEDEGWLLLEYIDIDSKTEVGIKIKDIVIYVGV